MSNPGPPGVRFVPSGRPRTSCGGWRCGGAPREGHAPAPCRARAAARMGIGCSPSAGVVGAGRGAGHRVGGREGTIGGHSRQDPGRELRRLPRCLVARPAPATGGRARRRSGRAPGQVPAARSRARRRARRRRHRFRTGTPARRRRCRAGADHARTAATRPPRTGTGPACCQPVLSSGRARRPPRPTGRLRGPPKDRGSGRDGCTAGRSGPGHRVPAGTAPSPRGPSGRSRRGDGAGATGHGPGPPRGRREH